MRSDPRIDSSVKGSSLQKFLETVACAGLAREDRSCGEAGLCSPLVPCSFRQPHQISLLVITPIRPSALDSEEAAILNLCVGHGLDGRLRGLITLRPEAHPSVCLSRSVCQGGLFQASRLELCRVSTLHHFGQEVKLALNTDGLSVTSFVAHLCLDPA